VFAGFPAGGQFAEAGAADHRDARARLGLVVPGLPATRAARGNGGAVVICVAAVICVTAGPVPPTAWLSQPHAYYRVAATTTRLAAAET